MSLDGLSFISRQRLRQKPAPSAIAEQVDVRALRQQVGVQDGAA